MARAASRNLIVLAAGMAALYGMVELVFGIAAATFEELGGAGRLAGLAPAIFLASAAVAALPAGRAMDRTGYRRVLACGFAAGLAGCLLAALGIAAESLVAALVGFMLTGVAVGTVLLSRAAAAEMFPPDARPRAIAKVLFGAVFGALLGPLVFSPLLGEDSSALDLAWLGGAGFMAAGLMVISRLRPDPREIAAGSGSADPPPAASIPQPPARVRALIATPGVAAPLLAVLASLAGMVAAMSLVGSALVDHGHEHGDVFPVLAAHFLGMFGFFAVVGPVIERIGRVPAIAIGLVVIAAAGIALAASLESIHLAALLLFAVGLGWSLSFVAATAELTERAPSSQRATLVGLADLLGNMSGAGLVVAGGFALDAAGVAAIAAAAATLPLVAAGWIWLSRPRTLPAQAGAG
jgi:MFS family permease